MIEQVRTYLTRLFEWWADLFGHHSPPALLLSFLATAGVLIYAVNHSRSDTELTEMISDKLPYRKLEKEFQSAFLQLTNTPVVVIDADTPEGARFQREKLAERPKKEKGLFKGVYAPGSGESFEKNGFLYRFPDDYHTDTAICVVEICENQGKKSERKGISTPSPKIAIHPVWGLLDCKWRTKRIR